MSTGLHTPRALLAALVVMVGCAGAVETRGGAAAPRPDESTAGSGGTAITPRASQTAASATSDGGAGASDGPREFQVTGERPGEGSAGFDVSASSDLPTPVPSTAQPYARVVESAVSRLRPALAECLRPLGVGRRLVRTVVALDGTLAPRPPQPYDAPPRVASCVEGVLHATTIDPPPPREYPYDIYLDVAPR